MPFSHKCKFLQRALIYPQSDYLWAILFKRISIFIPTRKKSSVIIIRSRTLIKLQYLLSNITICWNDYSSYQTCAVRHFSVLEYRNRIFTNYYTQILFYNLNVNTSYANLNLKEVRNLPISPRLHCIIRTNLLLSWLSNLVLNSF